MAHPLLDRADRRTGGVLVSHVEMPPSPKAITHLTLSPRDEEQLRRRVGQWARRFLGLSDRDFEDPYQTAWVRVMKYTRAGRPIRNL